MRYINSKKFKLSNSKKISFQIKINLNFQIQKIIDFKKKKNKIKIQSLKQNFENFMIYC